MTPMHPFGIFPQIQEERIKCVLVTEWRYCILWDPYTIETNMEADVCIPEVESSRLLCFFTARNVISVTTAVSL